MSVTIELSPETEKKLKAEAAASGRDVSDWVLEAVEEKLRTSKSFAEILAPIQQGFRESGMPDAELDALLEQTLTDVRREHRERQKQAP
jgi:hypothetical protein